VRHISEAIEAQREILQTQDYTDPDDRDEYTAANVFWMPEIVRWSNLKANAHTRDIEIIDPITNAPKKVDIGGLIDAAMEAIELDNTGTLRGVLPKDYGRPSFDRQMIGDFGGFILQHQNA
jgi:type I restriction enzyme M protein